MHGNVSIWDKHEPLADARVRLSNATCNPFYTFVSNTRRLLVNTIERGSHLAIPINLKCRNDFLAINQDSLNETRPYQPHSLKIRLLNVSASDYLALRRYDSATPSR